jgi:hypothetical protein
MIRKLIFLVFRNNHRFNALGNFAKSARYGDILLIVLGGPIKSIVGKILYYFKLGKFISIDGDPFLFDEKCSINLWLGGTSMKISKKYKDLNNNFVNMENPLFVKEKKLFRIYPILKKNYKINKKPKIIFMGKIFFKPGKPDLINPEVLKKNQKEIMNNFSLIDDYKFWSKINKYQDDLLKFENYKIIKTFLREQIIIEINKKFGKYFSVYGECYKEIGIEFLNPIYSNKKIVNINKGNICLDTGSILGSSSIYPRSIQIIESGGLLVQSKQSDSEFTWGGMTEKIVFNKIDNLLESLENYLSNEKMCNETLNMLFEKFSDSEIKMYKNFNKSLFN